MMVMLLGINSSCTTTVATVSTDDVEEISYSYTYSYMGSICPVIYVGTVPYYYYRNTWYIIPRYHYGYIRHLGVPMHFRGYRYNHGRPVHRDYRYRPNTYRPRPHDGYRHTPNTGRQPGRTVTPRHNTTRPGNGGVIHKPHTSNTPVRVSRPTSTQSRVTTSRPSVQQRTPARTSGTSGYRGGSRGGRR